jgi:hypothetical protein
MADITESGKPIAKVREVKYVRQENGRLIFQVGSGAYDFVSKLD